MCGIAGCRGQGSDPIQVVLIKGRAMSPARNSPAVGTGKPVISRTRRQVLVPATGFEPVAP